jgi:putative ABC transport system permease protein
VTVQAAGQPIELTIVGWYREQEDLGEVLRFSFVDLEAVRPDATPEWASVNVADGAAPLAVAASLTEQLGGAARVEVIDVGGSDMLETFRFAFLAVSTLVVIVALANLASTMVLAVRQRTHDLGVLRAVGVTPRQVVTMVAVGAAAIALAAAVVGVPLGWAVSNVITEVVGSASGLGPGVGASPGLAGVLVVVPMAVGVAAVLGALASRRAVHAEVSDLVRYE